jgi:cyclic pyranopterin monophosphate synthase
MNTNRCVRKNLSMIRSGSNRCACRLQRRWMEGQSIVPVRFAHPTSAQHQRNDHEEIGIVLTSPIQGNRTIGHGNQDRCNPWSYHNRKGNNIMIIMAHDSDYSSFHQRSCINMAQSRNRSFHGTTTTTSEDKLSSEEQHRLFREQMNELQMERDVLFGSDSSSSSSNDISISEYNILPDSNSRSSSNNERVSLSDLQKQQRESMYDFTDEEKMAWSHSGGAIHRQKHDPQFLQSIEAQRQEYFTDYQSRPAPPPTTTTMTTSPTTSSLSENNNNNNNRLSHVSADGTSIQMVDIGAKQNTKRIAIAQSKVTLPDEVIRAFTLLYHSSQSNHHHNNTDPNHEKNTTNNTNHEPQQHNNNYDLIGTKGPIFATAKIAGIMAAKKTSDLIPLCHPLPLDYIHIDITFQPKLSNDVLIECTCQVSHYKTGVEMEALVGATMTALTIYDMTKAISHHIVIHDTKLIHKSGGKRTFNYYEEITPPS